MKYSFVLFTLVLLGCKSNDIRSSTGNFNSEAGADSICFFSADPQKGFNFDFLIYFPEDISLNKEHTLLVESSNTGVSDSMAHHRKEAKYAAKKSSIGNYVSKKLKTPLLVPIFPRSKTNWKVYTHAFDSETFNQKGTQIERLDVQLINMIEYAKTELDKRGFKMKEKFFLTGFSASGTFANRFAILHPNQIKAACAGGFNAILILPEFERDGVLLNFPIGINNVEKITKNRVDLEGFKKLPQFWFMGENDTNDATLFKDAYNNEEKATIYSILGEKMIPQRWNKVQNVYKELKVNATFKTYKNTGHNTNSNIIDEIVNFFNSHEN